MITLHDLPPLTATADRQQLLCRWHRNELPAAIRGRQPPHVTQPELVKLVSAFALGRHLASNCL